MLEHTCTDMSSTSKSTEYTQLPLNSPEDNDTCAGVQIDCNTQRANIIQRSTSTTDKHAVDQWIQRDLNSQLFTAIFNRDLENVESLLQQGANPNTSCRCYKFTAIHLAVLTGSEKILLQLLTKGAKCTATDRLGLTPLHYASWYNQNKCMELLLHHMDRKEITNFINTKAEKRVCIIPDCAKDSLDHLCYKFEDMLPNNIEPGCTALHVACQKVHESCVEMIIRHKPNMQLKDDRNLTAFEVIGELLDVEENLENDFIQIINTVKFFGGKKESSIPIYYFTPIHAAVALSSSKGIKLLINSGLKADQLDENGETPIHLAIIKQQPVALKTLLDCIPDVSVIRNAMGLTPFQAAVERQWMHGIGMLLKANVNVTEVAADGRTVLHVAAASGNVDLLEELFELDDINKILNTKNNIGESPIYCAISSGKLDCVQFLIAKEVDLSIKLKGNINVLHRAAELGHADILSVLLKVDKEDKIHLIDERDTLEFSGMTPLHMAAWNNNVECVKELITYNCHFTKLTSPSPHCSSMAAHLAAIRDHDEILVLLLEHDSRLLTHLDGELRNPLICAALHGSRKCIEILLNAGADLALVYQDETALDIIFRNVSRPTEFLETMFDTRISIDDKNTRITDKTCLITINFGILIPKKDNQMEILTNILDNGKGLDQRKLLLHPLIECFLHLKWKKMSNIFWTLLLFYALFVLFLTMFAMSMFYFKSTDRAIVEVFRSGLILLLFIVSGLEILLLIETIKQFKINLDRFIKWLSIILVAILILCPFHITDNTDNSVENNTEPDNLHDNTEPHNILRHIGTLAVLTSWIQMMFLLSKVPKWGYYVQMFFKVSKNVLKVMAIFSVLVIGFALAFMIEFQSVDSFSGPFIGIVKTIVMMTSELDYAGIFSDNHNAHVINLTIYLTFLVLASIVLMNLMVGLAVSDIHDLEIIGKIDRHAQQIEFLSSLDTVTMAKYLPSSVKKFSARNRVESTLKIYPSDPKCRIMKMLPAKLKNSVFDIAEDNVTRGSEITLSQISEKMDYLLKMIENLSKVENVK